GDPEQEQAAGRQQAVDAEKADGRETECDPQHQRQQDAPANSPVTLLFRQRRRRETDRHRIVGREREIDEDDLEERTGLAEDVAQVPSPSAQSVFRSGSRLWICSPAFSDDEPVSTSSENAPPPLVPKPRGEVKA